MAHSSNFIVVVVLIFLTTCIPVPGHAVALLSNELELYLPWVTYTDKIYSAQMNTQNGNELKFKLLTTRIRRNNATESALADANNTLQLTVPLVGYRGELYRAALHYVGQDEFQLTDASSASYAENRGLLLSASLIATKTVEEIILENPLATLAGLDLRFDVAIYRITYQTQDAFGNRIPASGIISIPLEIPAGAPILSFQHGTITDRSHAPSVNPEKTGADLALYLMGARGYLVTVPDYLGLGSNIGLHPFMHAKTLAWAVIDLIRATRTMAADNDFPLNGQLFLAGYSEGGYATMAAQREIETYHAEELNITASAPMAGAYDLSGTMLQQVLSGEPLPRPMYFPYLLLAYNQIYGFDDNIGNLLNTKIATGITDLFDGSNDSDTINAMLPRTAPELFSPALLNTLRLGQYHPLSAALAHNDVYRWTPVSPTRLYHCLDDKHVPYSNALVAMEYFSAVGANHIRLETLFFGNHQDCAIPALLKGSDWFDTLVELP